MSEGTAKSPSLRLLFWVGGSVLLLLLGIASARNWGDLVAAHSRQDTVEAEIAATKEKIAELEERIHALRHEPTAVERLAREELGLAKDGEIVVLLPEEPTAPLGAAAGANPEP